MNSFFGMNSLIDALLKKGYKIGSFFIKEYWLGIESIAELEKAASAVFNLESERTGKGRNI